MRIGPAAAEVPGDGVADLFARGPRVAVEERLARHHHSGGAEAALQGVGLDEGLLDRREAPIRRQPLDRGDLLSLDFVREEETGTDALAVDQHRAGAAGAPVADDLGAGQPEPFAQSVGENDARLDGERVKLAVDVELDWNGLRPERSARTRGSLPSDPGGNDSGHGAANEVTTRETGFLFFAAHSISRPSPAYPRGMLRVESRRGKSRVESQESRVKSRESGSPGLCGSPRGYRRSGLLPGPRRRSRRRRRTSSARDGGGLRPAGSLRWREGVVCRRAPDGRGATARKGSGPGPDRRSGPTFELCSWKRRGGRAGRWKVGRGHVWTPAPPRSTLFPYTTLFGSARPPGRDQGQGRIGEAGQHLNCARGNGGVVGRPDEDSRDVGRDLPQAQADRLQHLLLGVGVEDDARAALPGKIRRLRQVRTQDRHDSGHTRRGQGLQDRFEQRRAAERKKDLLAPHPSRETRGRYDRGWEAHFFLPGFVKGCGGGAGSCAAAFSHRRAASSFSIAPRRAAIRNPEEGGEERRRRTSDPRALSWARKASRRSAGDRTSKKATRASPSSLPGSEGGMASHRRSSLLPAAVTR